MALLTRTPLDVERALAALQDFAGRVLLTTEVWSDVRPEAVRAAVLNSIRGRSLRWGLDEILGAQKATRAGE